MRAYLLLATVMLAGMIACGEATEPAPAPAPPAAPDAVEPDGDVSFDLRQADATALVLRLQRHAETRAEADRILDELAALRQSMQGIESLSASPAPMPYAEAEAISKQLTAASDSLVSAAGELAAEEGLEDEAMNDARMVSEALTELSRLVARAGQDLEATKMIAPDASRLRESDVTMRGGEGARGRFDDERIYHGDPSWCEKPAVVDVDAVYAKIPEYREILEKKPPKDGPRYYFLLIEAGKTFRRALKRVAARRGLDVIGGLGAIEFPDRKVPDVTADVIEALEG